jgi:hypothetical protein
MEYLRSFAMDSTLVSDKEPNESVTVYKRRVYDNCTITLEWNRSARDEYHPLWQNIDWPTMWTSLAETPVPGETKTAWYKIINGILPTIERLQRIRIAPTDNCRHCDKRDTIQHRLIECGEGELIWTWTRQRIARVLRTIPGRIPSEWLISPHFTIWSQTRRRAVQWILANVVLF